MRSAPLSDPTLHVASGELRLGDSVEGLEPKVVELILYLVRAGGRVVANEELIDSLWRDSYVSDSALWRCMKEARKALGNDAKDPEFIETLPRRGYRYIGGKESLRLAGHESLTVANEPPAERPAESAHLERRRQTPGPRWQQLLSPATA